MAGDRGRFARKALGRSRSCGGRPSLVRSAALGPEEEKAGVGANPGAGSPFESVLVLPWVLEAAGMDWDSSIRSCLYERHYIIGADCGAKGSGRAGQRDGVRAMG